MRVPGQIRAALLLTLGALLVIPHRAAAEGPLDVTAPTAAVADPPGIGRRLSGQRSHTRTIGNPGAGQSWWFATSGGRYSHRGTGWRRSGKFDRLAAVQGGVHFGLGKDGFARINSDECVLCLRCQVIYHDPNT